jgi:hypothetical protein
LFRLSCAATQVEKLINKKFIQDVDAHRPRFWDDDAYDFVFTAICDIFDLDIEVFDCIKNCASDDRTFRPTHAEHDALVNIDQPAAAVPRQRIVLLRKEGHFDYTNPMTEPT